MQAGYPSALDDNFISHDSPTLPSNLKEPQNLDDDMFRMHIRLAKLCSDVLYRHYSRSLYPDRGSSCQEDIESSLSAVQAWLDEARSDRFARSPLLSMESRWCTYMLRLCIHARALSQPQATVVRLLSEEGVRADTAEILASLAASDPAEAHREPELLRAAVAAFCLAGSFVPSHSDSLTLFRHMGFALGFFARLNGDLEFAWVKCAAVLNLVQKSIAAQRQL
ncbi:hypothetical protein GQ44DRAFT_720117 [Phaeosphaeriaceae sp. PMI808]|nr:hypothetical protein GQ44DRAFT_720117 [Phaeosphaeriaceae sp. PMI808]